MSLVADHWAARRGSGSDGSGSSTRPAFGLGGGGPRCSMCPLVTYIAGELVSILYMLQHQAQLNSLNQLVARRKYGRAHAVHDFRSTACNETRVARIRVLMAFEMIAESLKVLVPITVLDCITLIERKCVGASGCSCKE